MKNSIKEKVQAPSLAQLASRSRRERAKLLDELNRALKANKKKRESRAAIVARLTAMQIIRSIPRRLEIEAAMGLSSAVVCGSETDLGAFENLAEAFVATPVNAKMLTGAQKIIFAWCAAHGLEPKVEPLLFGYEIVVRWSKD